MTLNNSSNPNAHIIGRKDWRQVDSPKNLVLAYQLIQNRLEYNHVQRREALSHQLKRRGIDESTILSLKHTVDLTCCDTTMDELSIIGNKYKIQEALFQQIKKNPENATLEITEPSKNKTLDDILDEKLMPFAEAGIMAWLIGWTANLITTNTSNFYVHLSIILIVPIYLFFRVVYSQGIRNFSVLFAIGIAFFMWKFWLPPYLYDLKQGSKVIESTDVVIDECHYHRRYGTFPCLYIKDMDGLFPISETASQNDIQSAKITYYPNTRHWQDLVVD